MARYAGIKHEVAVKIALSAQWMDESFISDPTSMLILPIGGVHKRRLLHFPAERQSLNGKAQRKAMGFEKFVESHTDLVEKVAKHLGYSGDLESMNGINIFTK